jgi:hypothetical protein
VTGCNHRPVVVAAACGLALLVGAASAPAETTEPTDPAPLLLRLPDLGPGYVITKWHFSAADRSCTVLRGSSPGARRVFGSGMRRGCSLSFYRVWTPPHTSPDPKAVETSAYAFGAPTGPAAVLARPRRLAAIFLGRRSLRVVEPAPQIGDQAVLMRKDTTILGLRVSGSLVMWRSGSLLGAVVALSLAAAGDRNVQAAVRLAALQQARIAHPTPLRPPVNDDRFVPLDDPTLDVPVVWLSEEMPAHERFPELDLRATDHSPSLFGGSRPPVQMIYGAPHSAATVTVELWRPRALRRDLHRPPDHDHCQRRFDAGLPGGRATIIATYRRRHGRCPHHDARYTAVAFFNDVGVWIGAEGRLDPYDSPTGLRTLLRALRRRAPRPLPTPAP